MRFDEHDVCANEIAQCYEDIRELKALLVRAADALDAVGPVGWQHPLIAELRKAAE